MKVVRCKDCRYWDTTNCSDGQGWCPKVVGYRTERWYCASGDPKEKDQKLPDISDNTMSAIMKMGKNSHREG